jgi:HPt (histidine-containing phosphotransfer) domain-containing protein
MKAAHRIKGSASYLCCEQLKAVSLKLQDAGHEGTQNTAKAAEILASIEALFTEFKVALEDLKNEIKNGKIIPFKSSLDL